MDSEQLRRRFIAAQALAGMERMADLAEALNEPGLKVDTLYAIRAGNRVARPHELRRIAEVCELPYEFFTMDFDRAAALERVWSQDSFENVSLGSTEDYLRKAIRLVEEEAVGNLVQPHEVPDNVDRMAYLEDPLEAVIEAKFKTELQDAVETAVAKALARERDATREAVTGTRKVTQALKDRAVGDDPGSEAAGDTRDEADATQESARSRRGASR